MRLFSSASFRFHLLTRFFANQTGRAGLFLLLQTVANSTKVALLLAIGRGYEQFSGGTSARAGLLARISPVGLPDGEQFAVCFAVLALVWGVLNGLEKYQANAFGERFAAYIRSWNLNHCPPNLTEAKGSTLLRYGGDLSGLQRYLVRGLLRAIGDFLLAAGLWIAFVQVDAGSAIVAFCIFSVGITALIIWRYKPAKALQNKRRRQVQLLNWLQVSSQDDPANAKKRFVRKNKRLLAAGLAYRRLASPADAVAEVLPYLMFAAVILAGAFRSDLPPVTVLILLLALAPVHRRLLRLPTIWQQGRISIMRLEARALSVKTSKISDNRAPEQVIAN